MRTAEFRSLLKKQGDYVTPEASSRFSLFRLLGRSNVWFYLRSTCVTMNSGLIARLGLLSDDRWAVSSHQILSIFEESGGRFDISGVEHIAERTRPCVYVCNHMSSAETYLLPCVLLSGGSVTIVVKNSLLRYPGLGIILRSLNAIGVDRKSPREDLKTILREGKQRLESGVSVLIFPQSTRTTFFDAKLFNSIGAKLAHRAGVDIVPVAVKTDFLGVGSVLRDFGPLDRSKALQIRVFPPINTAEVGEKAAHAESSRLVASALDKWGVEVR